MKKYVLFVFLILALLISCDFPPVQPKSTTLKFKGNDLDIYWQLLKEGDLNTGEYKSYPIRDMNFYDLEPGSNYTLRFYKVESTTIENETGILVEKRLISDTYETHIVIDYWETIVIVTWNKESGLGCRIEQSWPI